jgi:aryl-alcohol dehydrogenase-like predicted oxidoreductase
MIAMRAFGTTGISVSAVGLGCAAIGDPRLSEADAARLLSGALDLGIALFDTARSYGLSEERIGRHLGARRAEIVLSTKVGYGVPGLADWTGPCVSAGIDRALGLMRTDVLDVVHLHSCPVDVLEQEAVVSALEGARDAGKIRVAAYSGDGDPLRWAVASGRFGGIQASVNLCDQAAAETGAISGAASKGMGVIAKRPLANAPWRAGPPPADDAAALAYRTRWAELDVDLGGLPPEEAALRFAAFLPGVSAAIVGTRSLEHLERNVAAAARGPLPPETDRALRDWFHRRGATWSAMI